MKNKKRSLGMLSLCLLSFLFLSGGLILGVTSALTLANIAAGGVISFEVSVSDESVYADLYFTCNSTTKTASVSAKSKTITGTDGTIEIPAKILHDGEVYDVTAIDAGAYTSSANKIGFYNCSSIKQIVIPDSIISIGNSSFYGSGLTSITVPKSVTSIGTGIFRACKSLSSIEVEDGNAIYYGKGNSIIESSTKTLIAGCKDTVIPTETLIIGAYAFADNTALTTITIPSNVTEIKSNAFYSCSGLTSITIPGNVKTIGAFAFESCYKISSITLNEGLQTIGSYAFYYCGSSSSVSIALTIPASVTSIASGNPFRYSSKITSITVASGNTKYYSSGNAIIETSTQKLIVGCKNSTIASTVKTIGGYAIYGMGGPTSITIPASVTTIEAYALGASYSWSLTSVTFANTEGWTAGTTAIESSDLASGSTAANTLKSNYSKKWTWADTVKDETEYSDLVFTQIGSTTNANVKAKDASTISGAVVIPDRVRIDGVTYTVTEIATSGFQNTTNLTSVSLPSTLTKIGNLAFVSSGITSIDMPDSVVSVGPQAFYGCSSLASVKLSNNITELQMLFTNCSSLTSITIPSKVESIFGKTFEGCSALTSVTFENPEGWMYGDTASTTSTIFSSSDISNTSTAVTYLTTTYIGAVWTRIDSFANLVFESIDSTNHCAQVSAKDTTISGDVIVPSYVTIDGAKYTVTTIKETGFMSTSNLTSLSLPATLTTIGRHAFQSSGITSFEMPDSIVSVDLRAFAFCSKLESVKLSNNLTELYQLFRDCSSLTSITIPSKVEKIASTTFQGCSALTSVTFENLEGWTAGTTALSSADLANSSTAATYLKTTYTSVDWVWDDSVKDESEYSDLVFTQIGSTTNVNVKARSASTISGAVVIPDRVKINGVNYTVTEIAQSGFADAINVTSYTLPETITVINDYAFQATSASSYPSWTTISLPSGITAIAAGTFRNCKALTSITLPNGVETIGTGAFYNSGLTSITLNEGLKTIQANAFNEAKLTSLSLPASLTSFVANSSGQRLNPGYLTSITVASGNTVYKSSGNTLIELSSKTIIIGCKNSVIPTDATVVTTIGSNAFYGCAVSSLTIPANITSIKANAFIYAGAGSITFVNTEGWTAGTTTLSSTALANATTASTYLRSTYVGVEWTWVDPVKDESEYSDLVFTQIGSTTNVNVKARSASTISGAVVIPDKVRIDGAVYTVTEIAANGFQNAVNVTSYTLPDTITAINDYAFAGSSSSKNTFTSINLPSNLTNIGASAFAYCSGLTSVNLPSKVTSIGQGAFRYCTGLASVNILSNINEIKVSTFLYCTSLENVIIPESVTSIGASAFANCTSLSDITIPTNVTFIGDNAFSDCTGLTTLTIPASVTGYGTAILNGCSSLTSLTLPYRMDGEGSTSFSYLGELWNSGATSSNQASYVPSTLKTVTINDFDYINDGFFANLSISTVNIYHDDSRGSGESVYVNLGGTTGSIKFYNDNYTIALAKGYVYIYGGMTINEGIISLNRSIYIKSGANPLIKGNVYSGTEGGIYIEDETWLNNYERSKGLIENVSSFNYSKTSISNSNYSSYFEYYTLGVSPVGTTAKYPFRFNATANTIIKENDSYKNNGYILDGKNQVVGILNNRKFRKVNSGMAYAFIVTVPFKNSDGSTTNWQYPILISGASAEAVEMEAFYNSAWHTSGSKSFTMWGKTWWYSNDFAAWSSTYSDTSGGNRINVTVSTVIEEDRSNSYLIAQACLKEIFDETSQSVQTINEYQKVCDDNTSTETITSTTSVKYECTSSTSDALTAESVNYVGNYELFLNSEKYLIFAISWKSIMYV